MARPVRHPARPVTLVLVGLVALLLAACGSRLDPDTVAGVNGGVQDGTVSGSDTVAGDVTGTDPGGSTGGGTDPGTTGGGGDPGTTTGGGDAGAPGDAQQGAGENAADGGQKAASCDGFKNQTGITDDTITVANVSDISGPVPGIFESAQQATRAYAAYFNSTSDICGRKLEVLALDSRADAGADQQAYAKACSETFAAVGSMSAFDSGGAATAENCGLPDVRSTSVNPERTNCSTCFSAQAVNVNLVASAMPKFFLSKYREATKHVALFYINAGASPVNAEASRKAWTKAGWNVDLFTAIDVAEFNFAPYVQQMKDEGIKMVSYIGPYQNTVKLQQAMQQQGFEPDVFFQDATIYDSNYVEQAGSVGDGTFVWVTNAPFDSNNQEMVLYRSWLNQVSPGSVPNFFGLYAWSAARLFVEQAVSLGGKLSRSSMVQALRGVKEWTGNGLHAPQQVGPKITANCISVLRLDNGKWSKVSSGEYLCGPLINAGG